jgi:hypothetical protein
MTRRGFVKSALEVLKALGLPRAQQNERSALCLLALLDLSPGKTWADAQKPLIGITPIMDWAREHYRKDYAPNTRETVRRQTMHQFVQAGIAIHNPDAPDRPVNSPKAVYQIEADTLRLLQSFGTKAWPKNLSAYLSRHMTLVTQYAKERMMTRIAVRIPTRKQITLSPGEHSELIRQIVEEFGSRFVPGGILIYAGDTGDKWGYFDEKLLGDLGVRVDSHGKMPDVALFDQTRNWFFLVEAVTSHGPVNSKRHAELASLFAHASAGIVFVTAFPNRAVMSRYLSEIAWETEVWVADAPTHMIHFDGVHFLGPHPTS